MSSLIRGKICISTAEEEQRDSVKVKGIPFYANRDNWLSITDKIADMKQTIVLCNEVIAVLETMQGKGYNLFTADDYNNTIKPCRYIDKDDLIAAKILIKRKELAELENELNKKD